MALNTDTSVVDYLKSTGQASDFDSRAALATKYGINNYTGDTNQNTSLLSALKGASNKENNGVVSSDKAPTTVDEANKVINSNQNQDFADASKSEEPETRSSLDTYNDVYKQVTESITKDLVVPEKVNLADTYSNLRTQYGITDLETSLSDLQTQANDLIAASKARTTAEKGKAVGMNVISGRISEEEAQDNERLTAINNSIKTITSQLETKYNMVDTIMKYTGEDYNNAVDSYNTKLSQNLQIMDAVKGVVDDQKTEEEKLADDARANAQIIISTMTANGTTFDTLSTTEKATLTKLGVQSGLGANFFSDVMAVSAGKDILTTIVSDDKTSATIMYKDGSTKIVSTGQKKSSNLSASEQKAEETELNRQTIMADVGRITGEDMKVSPSEMYRLRQDIALNNPELLTWFDNAYKPADFLNSTYYPRAVRENSWTAAIKEEEAANKK